MPDHIHLLVEGASPGAEFRSFMTLLRKRAAIAFHRVQQVQLWQDGYFERVLRREEDTSSVIQYIVDNPVRKGLVQNAEEYPFTYVIPGLTRDF